MYYSGALNKMQTKPDDIVQYYLRLGEDKIYMNDLIGKELHIRFRHKHICFCGKAKDRVYMQNFCYRCYYELPQAGPGVMRPELNFAHVGIARDLEWEKENFVQPHIVYLALADAVKVGVTRKTQIPTRWIDQGAWKAVKIAETPYRQLAGLIEVELKQHLRDKTNWRRMLKNEKADSTDLLLEKEKAAAALSPGLRQFIIPDNEIYEMHYPYTDRPAKVSSINLDKNPEHSGQLIGIKGQYLIFEAYQALNVRRYEGYIIDMFINPDA